MGGAVAEPLQTWSAALRDYERLEGAVPVLHAPGSEARASEVRDLLSAGTSALSDLLGVVPPVLATLLVRDDDWDAAPRENRHPYPKGLPYFTRSTSPPALVLPEELSPVFRPRTRAAYPLAIWHELAHAFVLGGREVVRTPPWLRELVPQAASAAVARREELPLDEHLRVVDREPGFTIRSFGGHAGAEEQMAFQNLLLLLGDAVLSRFGEGFLERLVRALWEESGPVGEERAEQMFLEALGSGGREWLMVRPEF